MSEYVHWIVELAVQPGKLDAFKTLVAEMVESTRGEAGCLAYDYNVTDDGGVCHIYECYKTSADAMIHLGNFGSKFAGRFLELVRPTGFNVYGTPSAEVRAGLAGFNPVFFKPINGFMR